MRMPTHSGPGGVTPSGGWHPDPLGRFQYRYWNGSAWTEVVANDGKVMTDVEQIAPPPPGDVAGSGRSKRENVRRIALASLVVVAMLAAGTLWYVKGRAADCYSVALEYGELARRVQYGKIDEVRHQLAVEVENDSHRRAAQMTLNFVSTSKAAGGELYPSSHELKQFIRNFACQEF